MTSESNDADVKIVDFGFATIADGCTLNKYCGTPGKTPTSLSPSSSILTLPACPFSAWSYRLHGTRNLEKR